MIYSEKKLIQGLIYHNKEAESLFIDKYKSWIIGIAIKYFKLDPINAEEIFQIVFLSLIENNFKVLRAWKGQAKFSTYLTVIVTRTCGKYCRLNKRYVSQECQFSEDITAESVSKKNLS